MAFEIIIKHDHRLLYLIIIAFALSSYSTTSLHHDGYHLPNDYFQEQNSGYDFRAFPSYLGSNEGIMIDNNSINLEIFLSDLKKLRRLSTSGKTVNVLNFGAKGDGSTDDTEAFQNAWQEACSSTGDVNYLVPQSRSYLLRPIMFLGPCKSNLTLQISGTIIASDDRSDYVEDGRHWLLFQNVESLVVQGGGTINGNGNVWWKNSCKIDKSKPCKSAPTAITFYQCNNLVIKNLNIQNAQQIHLSIEKCTNVEASGLAVSAPENSPNTDGIHIAHTKDIQISSCTIATGDDCISIETGSEKVRASDITCGPGHGISIGSLGSDNSEDYVSDIVVNGAKLSGTTNGVRIKTYQGGSGSASNIKFQNIEMQNVQNPIIIDQNYCDQDEPCKEQNTAVQIENVLYQNIRGTSASNVAINFDCSKSHSCQGVVLQNVNLVAQNNDEETKVVCNNVHTQYLETVSPRCP